MIGFTCGGPIAIWVRTSHVAPTHTLRGFSHRSIAVPHALQFEGRLDRIQHHAESQHYGAQDRRHALVRSRKTGEGSESRSQDR
jgi:hypothetical protein